MATVHPIQLQTQLTGRHDPVSKADIIKTAQQEGADENVRATPDTWPDASLQTPTDVSQAVGTSA